MSILELSVRSVLLRKRALGVAVLPLVVGVVAGILSSASPDNRTELYGRLTGALLLPVVVPLVALMLGVNAFDDERDEGTLPLLLATALPRWRIVLAKLAAAWFATWLVCLPATIGCIVLGASTTLPVSTVVWSVLLATLLTAGGYVGPFVLLSLLIRRAVLVGLAYIVLWEGVLANFATAFRNLSVAAFGRRLVAAPWASSDVPFATGDVGLVGAVVVLVVLVVVSAGLATVRLPRTSVT